MGIFVGTRDEFLSKLNEHLSGRGQPTPYSAYSTAAQKDPNGKYLPGPTSYTNGDIYGGIIKPQGGIENGGLEAVNNPQAPNPAIPAPPAAPNLQTAPAVRAAEVEASGGGGGGATPADNAFSYAPQSTAALQAPIYKAGDYIYLRKPDGSYVRQGRADVSGNNMMGAALKAGVEKAGLNFGGQWNGIDEARAQLMLNPDAWAKGAALQPSTGAALQPTGSGKPGANNLYQSGGYLYSRMPDGSFKKVGKANGTPQPTSNASRLETQAQGDISTGFTSGTQRGEGAANIAQKVRSGQMSLQAAMAQGYKPPPAALAA